jgi:hypothetical protein
VCPPIRVGWKFFFLDWSEDLTEKEEGTPEMEEKGKGRRPVGDGGEREGQQNSEVLVLKKHADSRF